MQAASSPIATPLPSAQEHQKQRCHGDVGLHNFTAGAIFNPSSYTRAMLGSPFGPQLPSFPFDSFDETSGRLSSSIVNDDDSFMQVQHEYSRNYICCGLNLSDLHALLEHFEDTHVVDVSHSPAHPPSSTLDQPETIIAQYAQRGQEHQKSHLGLGPLPHTQLLEDDTRLDAQLSVTSSASFPAAIPVYSSTIATESHYTPTPRSSSSNEPITSSPDPLLACYNTTVEPPSSVCRDANASRPVCRAMVHESPNSQNVAVVPTMLISQCVLDKPERRPCISKETSVTEPSALTAQTPSGTSSIFTTRPNTSDNLVLSSAFSRPISSLLLKKPFRCPKPNCNKSYKQANGLKYHMTHGSCSFAPPKDLEAIQTLLAERGVAGHDRLSEHDAREVLLEAERRLRPFACDVGQCTRRYRSMNGLHYHYQHSGDHGARGLVLLASGEHGCSQRRNGRPRKVRERGTGTLHPVSQLLSPGDQRQAARGQEEHREHV